MNLFYLVLGIVLLMGVVVDLLWTTLWVEGGAGPLTSRLMAWAWRSIRAVGAGNPIVLTLAGPIILVLSLVLWILFLWTGWTLVFASADATIVDTVNGGAVSWSELVYFTGYSVFTLGNGDFAPRRGIWQLATTLVSASGMLFITLSVSYVLSVLGVVTQKRALARGVHGLGAESVDILSTSWDGDAFQGLSDPLNSLATQLNTLTSNHKAYPVLHYFYSNRADRAPVVGVTVLDEALTLLRFGVPERSRPDALLLSETRSSVEGYLETVGSAYVEPAEDSPPPPEIASLREAGIPTVSDREFDASLADLDERRRTLLGLVHSDERQWPTERQSSENSPH